MKNKFSVICALCMCALMLLSTVSPLRLHVVANSDSVIDQGIKLKVRDAVLTEIGAQEDKSSAIEAVMINGDTILSAAQKVLKEENANYGVSLYLGDEDFPEKCYGDKVYPAGEYTALRVVLGEGGGKNWWCVIYPPLCIGDFSKITPKQKVVYKSLLGELFEKWFGKEEL